MRLKPLIAAVVMGGTITTGIWTAQRTQAQVQTISDPSQEELEEYESTAPGRNPAIPSLDSSTEIDVPTSFEPAPEVESSEADLGNPSSGDLFNDPNQAAIGEPETFDGNAEIESFPTFDRTPPAARRAPVRRERLDPKTFNKSEKKLAKAMRTIEDFMGNPKTKIEAELLQQSEGILILPDIVQAGFFFGGRRGTGILVLRNNDGGWSQPAFVSMTGGSLGLQIGARSSDLILVFPRRRMVHEAFAGSYKLGGNISGTAGALGRSPVDASQEFSQDRIYAISRSSGLFGGVSLEGAELNFNRKRNREFYGEDLTPREIFAEVPYVEAPRLVPPLQDLLAEVETGTFRLF